MIRQLSLGIACLAFLQSCVSREEINAAIWLNNGLPADICAREPELNNYGFYRRLNSGQLEFLPFCKRDVAGNPISTNYLAVTKEDFQKILDKALPKQKP